MKKEIIITNDLSEINRVVNFTEKLGDSLQLPSSIIMSINLALEEAIANIIRHAYPPEEQHEIVLEITTSHQEITFLLIDNGQSFDPFLTSDKGISLPLEQRFFDGVGIYLIRQSMDEISYQCSGKENRLLMKKKVKFEQTDENTMKTNVCKIDSVTIITVEGRLDTVNAQMFDTVLAPITLESTPNIIINCEGLTYISSSGLRSLISLFKCIKKGGGQLVLEAMRPEIYKIFEMTGCSTLFTIR